MKSRGCLLMGAHRGLCLHVCVSQCVGVGLGGVAGRKHHLTNKRKRPAIVRVFVNFPPDLLCDFEVCVCVWYNFEIFYYDVIQMLLYSEWHNAVRSFRHIVYKVLYIALWRALFSVSVHVYGVVTEIWQRRSCFLTPFLPSSSSPPPPLPPPHPPVLPPSSAGPGPTPSADDSRLSSGPEDSGGSCSPAGLPHAPWL